MGGATAVFVFAVFVFAVFCFCSEKFTLNQQFNVRAYRPPQSATDDITDDLEAELAADRGHIITNMLKPPSEARLGGCVAVGGAAEG